MDTGISLLIVDDSPTNLPVIESALEDYVDHIYTAINPLTVLDLCIAEQINIALIDVKMPMLSGIELLKQLKANPLTNHIVVVLMTGFSSESQEIISGLEAGAIDYLFKPLDLYIIRAKIQSIIELVRHQNQIKLKNKRLELIQAELQSAIESAERNKVIKDRFFANVNHEIRTPINAIVGIINLLKDSPDISAQQELVRLLEVSAGSVLALINDILDNAKIAEGKIKIQNEPNDIKKCFTSACKLLEQLATQKNIAYTINVDENIAATVCFDPLRINQILMNLLGNAVKFTNSGGVVAGLKLLEQKDNNVLLEITVADSGVGIAESAQQKIFHRFEQADDGVSEKFGGTGLGLSIVKSLIDLMGGEIEVQSAVGVGTTFTVRCWFETGKSIEADTKKVMQNFCPLNASLLLAEDDKINQLVTARMMKKWNIKVDIAEDGLEVLDKLKHKVYHLILMDFNMPIMDGYEVTRLIRASDNDYSEIPISSFSASTDPSVKRKGVENGITDFVSKPFRPDDLYHKIKKYIGQPRTASYV